MNPRYCWKSLKKASLDPIDLTHNEVAKLHLRHLVGGHAPEAKNEVLYRFEFPEKPGALLNFLESYGTLEHKFISLSQSWLRYWKSLSWNAS